MHTDDVQNPVTVDMANALFIASFFNDLIVFFCVYF